MTWLGKLVLKNIAVAAAYFLLGKFGLQIALPPGYSSAIWPAAGLAFATAALWGGRRIFCGIFLGSVLVNASVGGGFHVDDVAVAIALGSTLQALVGGYWLRKSMPSMLLNGPEQVLRFSLIGIGSAVIAATIGNLVLWAHGFIGTAELPRSFLTWWLGDAFGVQTFAPLTLLVLAPNNTWKSRRLSVGIPIVLSFTMSCLVYYFVLHDEEIRLQNRFSETVEPFSIGLLELDRIQGQALRQLADFYNVQDQAPGPELQKLADNALHVLPIYRAINWARVMDRRQSANFAGTIKYPNGFKPSASGFVAPVQMITPLKGNELALGLDLMGEERRFNSIQKALASGQLTMTQSIRLAQDPDGPGGALISAPVQNRRVRGVISGVMDWRRIGDQLKDIPGIQWELREVQNNSQQLVWKSLEHEMPHFVTESLLDRSGVYRRIPFDLADRHWVAVLFMPNAYLASDESLAPLLMLMLALLASGVFSTFALILSTHRERVEFEVMEKTAELNAEVEQRRNMQAALENSKTLAEEASLAKSHFLANMSHEIRTPMNAILGMLRLLQSTELSPRQIDYADKTQGAAKSLLGLLNDILDFSKIEAGKMTLDAQPFRLDRLMRDLSVILSANVGDKPVEVLFDIDPQTPKELVGDSMRLQQVLINLAGNAIKFTAQGEVVVQIKVLAQSENLSTIRISVRDTGIGIAPENQTHIFDGFSQAEASTTRRFGGTGLGLSISKRLVTLMGGTLTLDSVFGRGSTFSFELALGCNAEKAEDTAVALPGNREMQVLVVDDNAVARDSLVVMVRSLGWHVDAVASGTDAINLVAGREAASQPRYDVVFMDWRMPGMDGWETIANLRSLGAAARPEFTIMISALGREMLSQRSAQEQALLSAYLVKPVTSSMLFDAVSDALVGRNSLRTVVRNNARKVGRLMGMRLLVAEDNTINQQIAKELLNSEGAEVQIAENGEIAVACIAHAALPFDAVLMDLQMPVMDGYEATHVIRNTMGLVGLPIIAITANALASDRAACIAAGMNDHVGKPFDLQHLVEVLLRYTNRGRSTDHSTSQDALISKTSSHSGVSNGGLSYGEEFDLQESLQRMGGNEDLYARVLQQFMADMDGMSQTLAQTFASGDLASAARSLHTLKGLSSTVGANRLAAVAREAEIQIKTADARFNPAIALEKLRKAIDSAVRICNEVVKNSSRTPPVPRREGAKILDRVQFQKDLNVLQATLSQFDMNAGQLHASFLETYGSQMGDALVDLNSAMRDLDFEKALVACEQLQWMRQPKQ